MEKNFMHHPSSYRDPSGFIFTKDGALYRQVNKVFAPHFDFFISSGCYQQLVDKKMLIPHQQLNENLTGSTDWYTTLKPEPVPFLTWPYEWSFDMLKNAALLTLAVQKEALASGLILKDASAYNIQWYQGRFIFIDTLSFEKYNSEKPWIAYRQFCEHFLGPLLLMHYKKMPLQSLLLAWPDGIPLQTVSSLLPRRSKFSLHTYLHIHLNAKVGSKTPADNKKEVRFSKQKLLNLISSLETLISKLRLPPNKSTWSDYYAEAATRDNYLDEKKKIIREWIAGLKNINNAADLGANDGAFSRLLAEKNIFTVATDFDPYCINNLYLEIRKSNEKNILPLIADLANPSPAIGVNNNERSALTTRLQSDFCMALALIHHLAIGKNIPFDMIALLFHTVCRKQLLIEFVPKNDEKVKLMLSFKEDIYSAYSEENFEQSFKKYFTVSKRQPVGNSGRVLYLMTRNES